MLLSCIDYIFPFFILSIIPLVYKINLYLVYFWNYISWFILRNLSNNKITTINPNAFFGLENLRNLWV